MVFKQSKTARALIVGPYSDVIKMLHDINHTPDIIHSNCLGLCNVRYQIIPCSSIDKAKEVFLSINPDVVAISHDLSFTHIKDLVRFIRDRQGLRHPGIVVFSKQLYEKINLEQLVELGVDDVYDKEVGLKELLIRMSSLFRFKLSADDLRQANHSLEQLSLTDDLTKLHNMRSFGRKFDDLLSSCRNGEINLGMIMMDLDYFKLVNDRTNHLVGSYVISQVGRLISQYVSIPNGGFAARFGGDEFVIASAFYEMRELENLAKSIHEIIARAVFKKDGFVVRVTASIGFAWIDKCFMGSSEDPMKAADAMLYRSKHLGRDKVSGMYLRYPIDFNHIGRSHLIDGDTSRYHDNVSGFN